MSELSSDRPVRSRREDNILLGTVHLIDADGVAATGGVPDELTAAHYRILAYGSIQQFLDQQPDAYQPACVLLYTSSPGFLGSELHNALAKSGSTPAKSAKRSQAHPLQNLLRRVERAITIFETVDGRDLGTYAKETFETFRRQLA
jgi:hypothetical protein